MPLKNNSSSPLGSVIFAEHDSEIGGRAGVQIRLRDAGGKSARKTAGTMVAKMGTACALAVLVAACSQSSPPQVSEVDPYQPLFDAQDQMHAEPLYPPLDDPFTGQSLVIAQQSDGVRRPTIRGARETQTTSVAASSQPSYAPVPTGGGADAARYQPYQAQEYQQGAIEAQPRLGGPVQSYLPPLAGAPSASPTVSVTQQPLAHQQQSVQQPFAEPDFSQFAEVDSPSPSRPGEQVLFSIPQGSSEGTVNTSGWTIGGKAVKRAPLAPPTALSPSAQQDLGYGSDPLEPAYAQPVQPQAVGTEQNIVVAGSTQTTGVPQAASGASIWQPSTPSAPQTHQNAQRLDSPSIFGQPAPETTESPKPVLMQPAPQPVTTIASQTPIPTERSQLPALPPVAAVSAPAVAGSSAAQHHVQPGETLYAISRNTGVPLNDLIQANGLQPPYHIRIGQVLSLSKSAPVQTAGKAGVLKPSDLNAPQPSQNTGSVSPLANIEAPQPQPGSPLFQGAVNPVPQAPISVSAAPAHETMATESAPSAPSMALAQAPGQPAAQPVTFLASGSAASTGNALNYTPKEPAPSRRQHVVGPGDTLYAIARAYDVRVADLSALNRLQAPYNIRLNQIILVPPASGVGATGDTIASATAPQLNLSLPLVEAVSALPPPEAAAPPTGLAAQPKPVQAQPLQVQPTGRPMLPPLPDRTLDLSQLDLGPVGSSIPPRAGNTFMWPVTNGALVTSFGQEDSGRRSKGIDLRAPQGAAVSAAENGLVVFAGDDLNGFGKLLLLQHADGFVTVYGHNDALLVSKGQTVRKGDVIGYVGRTGAVSDAQLHFQVRLEGQAIDPMPLLDNSRQVAQR